MPRQSKIFRIFVSSTFEDMREERNALQAGAFSRLREYCRGLGWQFQAIDLRWGISEEATIDQKTMEICLREIQRCQEQSPRPNFIVLLGERYGWRPLPDRIWQSVEVMMQAELPAELSKLFHEWYELDENQLPEPVWRLKPRQGRYLDYNLYDTTVQMPLVTFFTNWAAKHLPDPDIIENKDNPLALQRLKLERSATEQEIQAGAFSIADAHEHVFAFLRELPSEAYECKAFHDADQAPVQRLLKHIKGYLPEKNVYQKPVEWDAATNRPANAHLDELDKEVESFLQALIDTEIERYKHTDENLLEDEAHAAFAKERTFGFSGREKDIEAICNYATSDSNAPFVLWGASGTGKSTLMAQAANKVQETLPQAHVITRFIGVTGKASNGTSLLKDICHNLCLQYGGEVAEIPEDPVKLEYDFLQYLAKATLDKPLVLFIDALDQFSEYDSARKLQWLPRKLPPNVRVIVSTLEVDCLDVLKQRYNPLLHEITPLTSEDGRYALQTWLTRANRKLQAHQMEQIIRNFENAECAPLYLHLAFDRAMHWQSHDRKQRLGRDIPEMIEEFYDSLSRPESHGMIVEKVLTSLRCAKQGLSDDEILGVLAVDEEFWNNFGAQNYHKMESDEASNAKSRRIPTVLWIRLYHDLEYYLTRRNAPGGEVITFYHRQLAEAVESMFLMDKEVRHQKHRALGNFFASKRWLTKDDAPLIANVRKCDELPWQKIKSEDWDAVVDTLCDLDFIQAKAVAKLTYEMAEDFNTALKQIPENAEHMKLEQERQTKMQYYTQNLIAYAKGETKELDIPACVPLWTEEKITAEVERQKTSPTPLDKLKAFYNFLGQEADNLQNYGADFPFFAQQQAWNWAADGPVGKAAEQLTLKQRQRLLLRIPHSRPLWNPQPQVLKNLLGHTDEVTSVALSQDGSRAVSGSEDNTLKVWDLESGKCLQTLEGHTNAVYVVALSQDGSRAVSGSEDNTLKVWDLKSGKCLQTLVGHTSLVTTVALSPDGSRAVSGSWDKAIKVWDLESGKCLLTLEGHTDGVNSVTLSLDGSRAMSGSGSYIYKLKVWDLESGNCLQILHGHTDRVQSIAIRPDGSRAVSGLGDNTIKVWDLESGKFLQTLKGHTDSVQSIAISPDGSRAVSGSWDNTLKVWDLERGKCLQTLKGHTGGVLSVALSPDGSRAVSGSGDNTIKVWDLERGKCLHPHKGHTDRVQSIALSPDGSRAVSGSWDATLRVWNLRSGTCLRTLEGHTDRVQSIALSPDGSRAVSGSGDNTLRIWYLGSGECLQTLEGHTKNITSLALSPDGSRVVSGSGDNTLRVWNLRSGKCLRTLKGHTDQVTSVALSPDGRRVVSGSGDNTLKVWDLESGKCLRTLEGHRDYVQSIALSPDGSRAVSGSCDKTLKVWDLESGKCLQTLKGHTGWVYSVALSPDGSRVVSGDSANTLRVWDLESGKCLQTLKGHSGWVQQSIALSPDGSRVVSGSMGKMLKVWDMDSGKCLAQFIASDCPVSVDVCRGGIFWGGSSGNIFMLHASKNLLCPGNGIVTAREIWDFTNKEYLPLSVDCPFCRNRFAPEQSVLDSINSVTEKAGLKQGESPCLSLPKEAWDESGILSNCPNCGESLKFNPFFPVQIFPICTKP